MYTNLQYTQHLRKKTKINTCKWETFLCISYNTARDLGTNKIPIFPHSWTSTMHKLLIHVLQIMVGRKLEIYQKLKQIQNQK